MCRDSQKASSNKFKNSKIENAENKNTKEKKHKSLFLREMHVLYVSKAMVSNQMQQKLSSLSPRVTEE